MPDWSQSGAWNFPGEDNGKDSVPPPWRSGSTPAARCG